MSIPDPEKMQRQSEAKAENNAFDNLLVQICTIGKTIDTSNLKKRNFSVPVIARRLWVLQQQGKIEVHYLGGLSNINLKTSSNGLGDIGEITRILNSHGNYSIKNINLEYDSGSVAPSSPSKPQPRPQTLEEIRKLKLEEIRAGLQNQPHQTDLNTYERQRAALADLLKRPSKIPTPAPSNSSSGPQRY
jgi:hypothetical protein